MQNKYNRTMYACFVGYIVQAIVNNFVPLLFLTFHSSYGIPLSRITLLVTINFLLQLCVDALSVVVVDRVGYRPMAVLAHVFSAAGLILLTVLPEALGDPFVGLLIAMAVYALGGGLLEVLISPIVEACPTDNKEKAMSLLHSFYCWGHVGVVLLSTLFFTLFGIRNWKIMALIWALIPIVNGIAFLRVPIAPLIEGGERGMTLGELARNKLFWLFMVAMMCAGASEQAVSQWASAFAEMGLGVSKTLGDLMGPMLFAIMMGLARAIYGKFGERIQLEKFMLMSCLLCVVSYLITSLSPWPALGLIGCGICGFSVGIFWPGTFSMASASLRRGGTALFCMLALGGDLGCSAGPTVVGMISSAASDNLKIGILVAILFPVVLTLCVQLRRRMQRD
ncbi:MAG: MFS transporter [Eubacteriales bacterium]|nr:MFS transporter [Eubacteriales bacterium]